MRKSVRKSKTNLRTQYIRIRWSLFGFSSAIFQQSRQTGMCNIVWLATDAANSYLYILVWVWPESINLYHLMDVSRAAAMLKNVDRMNVCARARVRDTHTSHGDELCTFGRWRRESIGRINLLIFFHTVSALRQSVNSGLTIYFRFGIASNFMNEIPLVAACPGRSVTLSTNAKLLMRMTTRALVDVLCSKPGRVAMNGIRKTFDGHHLARRVMARRHIKI